MIIFWIVVGLLFVCSAVLLTGRGAWLIAGYNTASKEARSRYDPRKLSRAAGSALLAIDLATIPLVLLNSGLYIIFYVIFLVISIIALLVYVNTKCFVSDAERPIKTGASSSKASIAIFIVLVAVALAVITGSVLMITAGSKPPVYSFSADNSAFTIDAMYGLTIDTSTIESVEFKTSLPDNLKRTNGFGGAGTVIKGYCSSSIGDVRVFIDTSKTRFVYITTPEEVIILSGESNDQTMEIYTTLSTIVHNYELSALAAASPDVSPT